MLFRTVLLPGLLVLLCQVESPCQPPPAMSTVTGLVVAADGKTPVAGRTIRLRLKGEETAETARALTAQTDAEGRFALERVPEGDYTLDVPEGKDKSLLSQDLPLRAAVNAEVRLVLKTVYAARGRMLAPDGTPLAGEEVSLRIRYRRSPESTTSRTLKATTDEEGGFVVVLPETDRLSYGVRVPDKGWAVRPTFDLVAAKFDLGTIKLKRGGVITATVRNKETQEPIPEAWFNAYGQSLPPELQGTSFRAQSDEQGKVLLSAVPPGTYSISGYKTGYLGSSSGNVTVTVDQDPPPALLELEPAVRLAGTVLAGPDRKPAKGALVSLSNYGSGRETDEEGRFEFPSVGKKTHQLVVKYPPYLPVTTSVEVTADKTDVEVVLDKEGLRVRGRLVGDEGKPVTGAWAAAIDPENYRSRFDYRVRSGRFTGMDQWPWREKNYLRVQTEDDGRFEITGLAPGSYHLLGLAENLPIAHQADLLVSEQAAAPEVELHVGWNQPLMLRGRLTDAEGNPVVDTRIRLKLSSDSRSRTASVNTDEEGIWWYRAREPGTYVLRLSVDDKGSAKREGLVLSREGVLPAVDLQLTPPKYTRADYGSIAGTLLMPDGKTPAKYAMVYPFIKCTEEDEYPGFTMIYQSDDTFYKARRSEAATADDNGRFVVTDLPPGTYGLCAMPWRPDDWRTQPLSEALAATAPGVIEGLEVQPKQAVTGAKLALTQAAMLRGVVQAADSGEPLANAWIHANLQSEPGQGLERLLNGRSLEARSAADGTFTLASLTAGTYYVNASAPDHKGFTHTGLQVEAGKTIDNFVIKLEQQFYGFVEGTALKPDGETPAAGAKVYVGSEGQWYQEPSTITGAEGKFRTNKLPESTYTVIVSYPDCAPSIRRGIAVKRDETTTVEFPLEIGGTVSGTVTVEALSGPEETYAVLVSPDQQRAWFNVNNPDQRPDVKAATIKADGTFTIPHVPTGKYTLNIWRQHRVLTSKPDVVVANGAEVTVDVAIVPARGRVSGTVTGIEDRPDMRARTMLVPAALAGPGTMGMNEKNGAVTEGKFTIEEVPPGEYWAMCMVNSKDGDTEMVARRYPEKITVTNETPVEGLEFVFGGGLSVSGVVTDAETKQPLAGAQVLSMPFESFGRFWVGGLDQEDPPLFFSMAMCDKEGKFTLTGLPEGKYTLSAMSPTMQHLPGNSEEIEVSAGAPVAQVSIALKKGDFQAWMREQQQRQQAASGEVEPAVVEEPEVAVREREGVE